MPEVTFEDAPEVESIARGMIGEHHDRLAYARIKYLLRDGSWEVKGRTRWGSAEKCSAKHKHLTGYDFIITVNAKVWKAIDQNQRRALVDHELCHCGKTVEGNWTIWPHDLEDFIGIVRRHGLWAEEVRMFAEAAVEATRQLTIFDLGEKKVS